MTTFSEEWKESLKEITAIAENQPEKYQLVTYEKLLDKLLAGNLVQHSQVGTQQTSAENSSGSERKLAPNLIVNEFFKKVAPKSHSARFVTAAYYFYHTGKSDFFTVADVLDVYGKLREMKPRNPSDIMADCIKRVLVVEAEATSDRGKTWMITPTGEAYVEEMLRENGHSSKY